MKRAAGRGASWILLACLSLLAVADGASGPVVQPVPAPQAAPRANPFSDRARDVLAQYCGQCHRHDLKTAVPRALAVFDLLEDPWYGRLAPDQFDGILMRVRGTSAISAEDAETVARFVRCARDGACGDPAQTGPPAGKGSR